MHIAQLFSKHNRFTIALIHVYLDAMSIIPAQHGNDAKIPYEILCIFAHSAYTKKACSTEIKQEIALPEPLTMVPRRTTSCFCFISGCDTRASHFRW